jgi:hypothetical protein
MAERKESSRKKKKANYPYPTVYLRWSGLERLE